MENIWSLELAVLQDQFNPVIPASFSYQLYTILVLYSLALCFSLAGCLARLKKKSLWLFRVDNGFIVPSLGSIFLFSKSLFAILSITALLQINRVYVEQGVDQSNILGWRTIVFLPVMVGAYFEAVGVTGPQIRKSISNRLIYNSILILIPVVAFLSILIPLLIANYRYNSILEALSVVEKILETAAANFDGTKSTESTELALQLPLEDIAAGIEVIVLCVRIAYSFYLASMALLLPVFLIGCRTTFKSINSQISISLSASTALRGSNTTTRFDRDCDQKENGELKSHQEAQELEARIDSLRSVSRQLTYQLIVFVFCALGYTAVTIIVVKDPIKTISDPKIFQLVTLSSFWIYALGGLPGLILVTIHSFKSGSFTGTTLRPPLVLPVVFEAEEDDFDLEELNEQLGVSPRTNRVDGANSVYQSDYSRSRNVSELDSRSVSGMSMKAPPSPLMDLPRDAFGRGSRERL